MNVSKMGLGYLDVTMKRILTIGSSLHSDRRRSLPSILFSYLHALFAGLFILLTQQAYGVGATGGTVTNYTLNGVSYAAHIFTTTSIP